VNKKGKIQRQITQDIASVQLNWRGSDIHN